jgi:GNAT superfamily N-acetyltransferase
VRIRPFVEDDRERWIEIGRRVDPDYRGSVEQARFNDRQARERGHFFCRLVAEDAAGVVVGTGQAHHSRPWIPEERIYWIEVEVDPAHQRRGVGSALYEHLLHALNERDAAQVRAYYKESRLEARRFLERRGFVEVERSWESRLDVAAFDFAAFAGAEERVAGGPQGAGITLTTHAAEAALDSDTLPKLYELDSACGPDEPSVDPYVPVPYEEFAEILDNPAFLPEAWFIAKDGERYVGFSQLMANLGQPGVLEQGFTCVRREYRGRGIAMALKLQTVKYARAHGAREIRTGNNTLNRPMLRINEAMGFAKQPVWVLTEKRLQ